MADGREPGWTRVSSTADVVSLETSLAESIPPSLGDGDASAQHVRRESEDGVVTSPLRQPAAAWEEDADAAQPIGIDPSPEAPQEAASPPRRPTQADAAGPAPERRQEGEIVADLPEPSAAEPPQPDAAPQGGGGGWWSSLATSVKRVAEGVQHDLGEINESLQKLLDDSEELGAPASPAPPATPASSAEGRGPDAAAAAQARTPQGGPGERGSPAAGARREEILGRLGGEDTGLEAGLKAMDVQVEQLTQGLGRALGSLWGGARGAVGLSARLAQSVESAAKEVGGHVEAGVREGHRGLAQAAQTTLARAEQNLEALGRRAADVAAPEAGRGRDAWPPQRSFRQHWSAAGGQQMLDELQALGSGSARACSALHRRLAAGRRERFEGGLRGLVAAFDAGQPLAQEGEGAAEAGDAAAAAAGAPAAAALAAGHAPVAELQQAGVRQAAAQAQQLPGELAAEDSPKEAAELVRLRRLAAEGGRLLAELCVACIERLLALGKSLAAASRQPGRPSSDGVRWPASAAANARLLQQQAGLLADAVKAVAEAWVEGIGRAADAAAGKQPAAKGALLELADALCSGLERDCEAGLAWLQEGFKGLAYVAALSGVEWAE